MKAIRVLNLQKMHVEEDFGFHQQIVRNCEYLPEDTVGVLNTAVETYRQQVAALDDALELSTVARATRKATKRDGGRDQSWRNSRNYLKAMSRHPDSELRAIALQCKEIYDKYGDPTHLSQTAESGVLHNLLADLQALDPALLDRIGFKPWMDDLAHEEQAFLAAVDERTTEEGQHQTGIVQQARREADTAYRALIDTVNLLATIDSEASYATFVNNLNGLIDRQKEVLRLRATLRAKKKAEAQEAPEGQTEPSPASLD